MMTRRQLFTWWRRSPDNAREPREAPLARIVEPTPIDTAEPFSLEAFYAARKEGR